MSRELKSRAWVPSQNRMTVPQTLHELIIRAVKRKQTLQDELIIMQYTGLKDKNGKEIYEGDELLYIGTNMSSMTVIFYEGCFMGEGPFNVRPLIEYINADDFQSIEIIGNIYENPELLNPSVK